MHSSWFSTRLKPLGIEWLGVIAQIRPCFLQGRPLVGAGQLDRFQPQLGAGRGELVEVHLGLLHETAIAPEADRVVDPAFQFGRPGLREQRPGGGEGRRAGNRLQHLAAGLEEGPNRWGRGSKTWLGSWDGSRKRIQCYGKPARQELQPGERGGGSGSTEIEILEQDPHGSMGIRSVSLSHRPCLFRLPAPAFRSPRALQQIAGQVRQGRALALLQRDVGVDRLPHHAADEVAQAVGQRIEIGMVDLLDVAGEDHLRAFAGPGDDRLDLVRREVLGLVDDEEHPLQAAAADVGQRRHHQLLGLQHLADPLGVGVLVAQLVANDRQVVVQRLHVRVELGGNVAGQIAQVAIAQRHRRPGQEDLPIGRTALQRRGQGQQRLARAGLAHQRHQLDVLVQQGAQGERLLGVAGLDAVGRDLVHFHEGVGWRADRRPAPISSRCGE